MFEKQRNVIRSTLSAGRFSFLKYTKGFQIGSEPELDAQGLDFFRDVIAKTSVYLEYGSGGSTLLAAKNVTTMVSVECDKVFLKCVKRMLPAGIDDHRTRLIHVDIGFTGAWGYPVFTHPTEAKRQRWKEYAKAPWAIFRELRTEPNLILVDGRFRVACALESVLQLGRDSECLILIDDYTDRPYYKIVEEFAELTEMRGRMAVFRKRQAINEEHCRRVLEQSYLDYR